MLTRFQYSISGTQLLFINFESVRMGENKYTTSHSYNVKIYFTPSNSETVLRLLLLLQVTKNLNRRKHLNVCTYTVRLTPVGENDI